MSRQARTPTITIIRTMFEYDFMRDAFAASGIVALVAGLTGYFLVLRAQAFAGHALGHIGFTGATGAVLIGLDPLWGLVLFTLAGGMVMGLLGERLAGRDVAIGMVLAVSLGLGVLFLYFFTSSATAATSLLFGDVLSTDSRTVLALAALGVVCLLVLAIIARPLLFASLQPELAEAAGVRLRLIGMLFLAVVALATAESASIVGVLLVFVLMIGPAASAQRLCARVGWGLVLSVVIGLGISWFGLALSYWTDWPASFWISALSGVVYLSAMGLRRAELP